jgi:hypothetical protein
LAVAIHDLLFMAGLVGWFWLIGRVPAALLPRRRVAARELAAPVLGFALFAVVASLAYRWGVPALHLFLGGCALAAVGFLLLLVDRVDRRWRDVAVATVIGGAAALLLVLPKWTGGAQFWVFQGNIWDQLSYLARSVSYYHFTAGELATADRTMPLANDFILFARSELGERPAVSIVHAAATHLAAAPPTETAYVFMAFLELLSLFAFAFVLASLGARRLMLATGAGAALAVSFFLQYIFDIDAWSELAGLPVMLAAGAVALVLLDRSEDGASTREDWRLAAVLALTLAAGLFLYPECVPIYMAPLAVVAVLTTRGRDLRFAPLVAAALLGVALTVPDWQGTTAVLVRQIHSAVTRVNDWFAYYQRYLIPFDLSPAFAAAYKGGTLPHVALWQIALFVPIDLATGVLGLYFLQPPPELPLAIRVLWRLVVLAGLASLFVCAGRELVARIRRGLDARASRLALWALLAVLTPLPLIAMGKLWAGGKAISMIGPFLFLLAASPVLIPSGTGWRHWRLAPALLYLISQLGFGLARPIAAAHPDGIHFALPYPSIQAAKYKTTLSWDLLARDGELRRCRRTAVDVESPFLERYVQLRLTDLGASWWSVRPLNSYFGIGVELGRQRPLGDPDCLVTDRPSPPSAALHVISLAR